MERFHSYGYFVYGDTAADGFILSQPGFLRPAVGVNACEVEGAGVDASWAIHREHRHYVLATEAETSMNVRLPVNGRARARGSLRLSSGAMA